MPHFWGCAPGGYAPHSNSAEIFVQCTHPQVSSSYVYSFGSYRVAKQTNPPNHPQTNRCRWKHPTLFITLRRRVMTQYNQNISKLSARMTDRLPVASLSMWNSQPAGPAVDRDRFRHSLMTFLFMTYQHAQQVRRSKTTRYTNLVFT